ncbi:hypothetical protein [Thomasclavelia cocleata]|uniref:hypothetical protein n=1 Tax=Thomasclavelia cocleata TaxID=69824 RepID=UPI00242B96EA|nr:hypothetical protein [Thomasclavelia cocleata]MCI9630115.1 hypothetical protein [Thomasclavelia cocleata]
MEYNIYIRKRDDSGNIIMKTVLKGYSREHAKRIIRQAIEVDKLNVVITPEIKNIIEELKKDRKVIYNGKN